MIKESAPAQHASPSRRRVVRIRRETKGTGAGVISIHGVPADQQKALATLLKKKCGTGGGQEDRGDPGDKRDLIKTELEGRLSGQLVGDNSPSRALPRGFSPECPLPSRGLVSPRTRFIDTGLPILINILGANSPWSG